MRNKQLKKINGITIDDLAVMVQRGFEETASKHVLNDLRNEINKKFNAVDKRFDIIENKLIEGHGKEIDHLREKILKIEVTLAKLVK